jgi:hypothetical protein
MTGPDVLVQLSFVAVIAIGAAVFIFGWDPRGKRSFHIAPRTFEEWLAYWFHTLEFSLACVLLALLNPITHRYLPAWGEAILRYGFLGSAGLLTVSLPSFWAFDPPLCRHALALLLLFGVGSLLIPAF